jgi:hypothetical protein
MDRPKGWIMSRTSKYLYLYVVQGFYNGWEDLTAESTRTEARCRHREYYVNDTDTAFRVIRRREPNPAWTPPVRYVATVNIPGYLPTDDDPPVFDDVSDAWDYLRAERERDEDASEGCDIPGCDTGEYSDTWRTLRYIATGGHEHGSPNEDTPTNTDGTGTVYGDTPCAHSERDLGLAYCVTPVTSRSTTRR